MERVEVEVPVVMASASASAPLTMADPEPVAEPVAAASVSTPPVAFTLATPGLPVGGSSPSQLSPPSAALLPPAAFAGLAAPMVVLGSKEAPGSALDGAPQAGQFKTGDTLHLKLMLQPNKCYTFIGTSIGMADLDLELLLDMAASGLLMPMPNTVIARDNSQGPVAVIGGGANCFKMPLPMGMPVVLVATARAGAGMAVIQAFSR